MGYLRVTKRTHPKNEWRSLVDGAVAYAELLAAIRAAKRFVYIATWSLDPGLELTRSGSHDPTLREVLLDRAKAGLEVKVLVWDHLSVVHSLGTLSDLFRPDIRRFQRELRDAGAAAKRGSSLHLTVNPHKPPGRRLATGSDHQKFWVMDEAGKHPFGFVGGLNLGQHEWDTTEHRPGDRRRSSPGINRQGLELQDALKDPVKRFFVRSTVEKALDDKYQLSEHIDRLQLSAAEKALLKKQIVDLAIDHLKAQKPLPPRHDITSRVRGPAAAELVEEFRVRWRLAASDSLHERAARIPSPSGARTKVQIGHTAYYPAPGIPTDIWRSYLHALKRAQSYIYLENQYFVSPSVANAIIARVRASANVQVIVVLPSKAEEFAIGPAIALRQSRLFAAIDAAARKRTPRQRRIHVLGLSKWNPDANEYEGIYVHAKIGLIDDRWMTIGSANCTSRSFELDTELNAFSDDVRQVTRFRKQLWSEHMDLAVDADILRDPRRAIKKIVEMAEANGKKKAGALSGRFIPLTFELPPPWLRSYYEDIVREFF